MFGFPPRSLPFGAGILAILAGCSGTGDKPADTGTPTDFDGDGYLGADDCDGQNADVHPGAAEVCDGVDNDCDGETDPSTASDATTWYADSDRDGAGDAAHTASACEQPTGYVLNGSDCDDTHADVYPGRPEVCDGLDNDCDGEIDPPDASGSDSWYADTDGDGFGDGAVQTLACTAPDGFVGDHSDCDDTNATVYPDAPELCDTLDNDCDGSVDPDTAIDAPAWHRDGDGDGYGADDDTLITCSAPPGYVAEGGDCDDAYFDAHPGGTEVCDTHDNDCDGEIDPDSAADASLWYGDLDGDGYAGNLDSTVSCYAPSSYEATVTDCDDTDADISPGAPEVCNGIDDNCDRSTDPSTSVDATTWHTDSDSDGFGATSRTTTSCEQPLGYVADGTDCNDSDPGANPSEIEVCDGVDNDCDGAVDPGTAYDATTWYADNDRDAYGDPTNALDACDAPIGYVADARDCNDASASARPGGTEVCDGVDNDCDGVVDPATTSDARLYYLDADGDGYGASSPTVTSCSAPAGYASAGGDCADTNAAIHPGVTDVPYDGVDQDCSGSDGTCADGELDSDMGDLLVADTTSGAGNNSSSSCGGTGGEDESWHWTAPTDGYFRVTTAGSALDTVLAAFSGDCSETEVTCNDDADQSFTSAITVDAIGGEGFIFMVDGYSSASNTYTLNIEQLDPAACTTGFDIDGDSLYDCLDPDCASAAACSTSLTDYNLGSATSYTIATGTTSGASNSFTSDCATTTGSDIAYTWTAPTAGKYVFTTAGSLYDTLISLRDPGTLDELYCIDDDLAPTVKTSTAYLTMRAGQRVIVVVDGYRTYAGTYYLGIYPSP